MQIDETAAFDDGITQANAEANGEDVQTTKEESADVRRWAQRIEQARKFDEAARKGYATDRRYARSDRTCFAVEVPIAQSYIDVMRSFLYARNPDVDAQPTGFTQPPPQKEIAAMVADKMEAAKSPDVAAGLPPAMAQALGTVGGQPQSQGMPGAPPPEPTTQLPTPPTLTGDDPDSQVQQQVADLLKPYQRVRDDAKQLSETLELVIPALWKKAKLKAQAKPLVGSALTVGIGWIKGMWLERMGRDPVIQKEIDDLHEQMARLAATRKQLDEGEGDEDTLKADLLQQSDALEAKVQITIARGFAIDFVPAEQIQVSTDCRDLASYLDASWIAHAVYVPIDQARVDYPNLCEKLKSASQYWPQKPRDGNKEVDSGSNAGDINARDADAYTKSGMSNGNTLDTTGEHSVMLWEVWNRDAGNVIQFFDGTECYAKPPFNPTPTTTRFYPFFQYEIGTVDGERHPRSLISRSMKLFDEYNSVRTNYRTHRKRAIPKSGFDATNWSHDEISKLENASALEMVALKPTVPGTDVSKSVVQIAYPPIDMALYDTGQIRSELEMIWGIQEALSSSIHTAKTLGEAEIQQQGTESRQGYMRDDLDEMLSDLAQYTGEIALQVLSPDDVKAIAGPWALWPEGMSIDDLAELVTITISAGSTGKPNTSAQRQAWAQIMPVISQSIEKVGQLRGSSPDEVADCIEALVIETINRTGDRIDAQQFLPDPPRTPPPPPPKGPAQPLDQSALAGQQIAQMMAMLVDVRSGVLTHESAVPLLHACFPAIPEELITTMVAGSSPMPMPMLDAQPPPMDAEPPMIDGMPPPEMMPNDLHLLEQPMPDTMMSAPEGVDTNGY